MRSSLSSMAFCRVALLHLLLGVVFSTNPDGSSPPRSPSPVPSPSTESSQTFAPPTHNYDHYHQLVPEDGIPTEHAIVGEQGHRGEPTGRRMDTREHEEYSDRLALGGLSVPTYEQSRGSIAVNQRTPENSNTGHMHTAVSVDSSNRITSAAMQRAQDRINRQQRSQTLNIPPPRASASVSSQSVAEQGAAVAMQRHSSSPETPPTNYNALQAAGYTGSAAPPRERPPPTSYNALAAASSVSSRPTRQNTAPTPAPVAESSTSQAVLAARAAMAAASGKGKEPATSKPPPKPRGRSRV